MALIAYSLQNRVNMVLLLPYSLLKEVLWSLAIVSEQREEVPHHVKLELSSATLIEMVVQDKLWEGKSRNNLLLISI